MFSFAGFAGLLILDGYFLLHGEWLYQYAGLCLALAILPFVLALVSWLRGHRSDRLEEPQGYSTATGTGTSPTGVARRPARFTLVTRSTRPRRTSLS